MPLADGISFSSASGGTGTFVYVASRSSFRTLAQAVTDGDLTDGQIVSYLAQDSLTNPTQREWGHGTFSASGNSVARTTVFGGTSGAGHLVNFIAPPIVSLTVLAEDLGRASPLNVTSSGTTSVTGGNAGDVLINVNGSVTIQLPSGASRGGNPVSVVDIGGFAATHNILILPNGAETIQGQASYSITGNYGGVTFWPISSGNWYLK